MGAMGPGSAFGGGSQSGSDFDFGTPQSLNIDTMMQSGDLNESAGVSHFRSAPATMPGNMQGFTNAFDPTLINQASISSGHMPHRGTMSSLPDGTSPVIRHQHRMSLASNDPFVGHDRHNSIAGSDTTSPGGGRGHDSIGDNPYGSNSNETVSSQTAGDGTGSKIDGQSNPPPPWSELKTKAGKERKRLPLACIACRRKKIRCSGEKPACKHCLRSRIPCVYKVTTRKAAPRTDYMAMLDKRLKRMEERVIKIIPKDEQGVVTSTGRAVVKPPLPPAPPKSAGSSKKRVAEAAFEDELDEWANAKVTTTETKDEAHDTEREPLKVQESEEQNLLQEGADKLPSKELQEHLAEVFFDYIYGQSYPLLHKPSFMRKLAQRQVPPVLMLAVCAISARFSTHPGVRTEPAFLRGENWATSAREISLRRFDTPNITILIVYLLLGLHEFGTCQGGRSWMFGGMAQRMAYALQLHRDLDHEPRSRGSDEKSELTFTDREIRRRTMWSCFLMDRFNSSGTERPIFVSEQFIRAQLPIKESFFQMEINGPTEDMNGGVPNPVEPETGQLADPKENMGVSAYLIRLVGIWGKLINYLNLGGKERDRHHMWSEESTFSSLKRATKDWKEALPLPLHYTPENLENHASENIANQFILLHIVYNQIILFTNRFALPTPGSRPTFSKDMPSEFHTEASRAAYEAANQISALIHEAMDHHVVAPFAGYCAFFSSTVHIYGAFSKNAEMEASSKQNLAWNVKYLTKMKKYWGMFHFVTENLRDLYRRHADATRSSGKTGTKQNEKPIFQYGDWFDRYPHGVSGTDYEEPSVEVKKEPGADAVLGQKSDLQTVEEFFSKLSPPSRAAQSQHQQQPQQRKMAKKRSSKSERKQSTTSNTQQQDAKPMPHQQEAADDMMTTPPFLNNVTSFPQHPGFPPVFQPPQDALLTTRSQQPMSQLDLQRVLNSYAGVNATSATNQSFSQNNNPMLDPTGGPDLDQFDFNAFATSNGNGAGFWGDPSSAWFMPFNMDPPSIGEENGVFNGNFDWANFGGFGDVPPGMPPTGLTPQPDIDMDTGQDPLAGDGSGLGLDGLDPPQ